MWNLLTFCIGIGFIAKNVFASGSLINSKMSVHLRNSAPCIHKPDITKLLVGETITFTSPNYPNEYDPSTDCGWKFKTDKDTVLELTCDDFRLRPPTNKGECRDFLKVNDFQTDQVKKHCGDDNPSGFVTEGRQINLRLITEKKKLSTGFSCSVTAKVKDPTPLASDCNLELTVTGGMEQVWSSPGYPGEYPEAITCTLHVTIPADPPMLLATVTFDDPSFIFNSQGCSTDNLEYTDSSGMIARKCGNLVPSTWSESTFFDGPKNFSFKFTSSASDGSNDKGFSLRIKGYDLTG